MKAVLIAIQPKWCELIASGKKTVEIRKTRPKLDTPFKVYVYCTNSKPILGRCLKDNSLKETPEIDFDNYNRDTLYKANGKVIGEFVCKEFTYIEAGYDTNENKHLYNTAFIEHRMCIPDNELFDYLYKSRENSGGWGWHISDLVIYDKPKELSEFRTPDWYRDCKKGCTDIEYMRCPVKDSHKADKMCGWCRKSGKPITRPPQSWCYCEESRGGEK